MTDALLVAGLVAVAVLGLTVERGPTNPIALVLVLPIALPLLGRRRWPRAVLATTVAATALYLALDGLHEPVVPAVLVGVYTVTAHSDQRWALAAAPLTAAVLLVAMETSDLASLGAPDAVGILGSVAVAFAFGAAMRTRRTYTAVVEERAVHAEQTREAEARQRVAEERLRIARDLHDVLAHSIAVINVQAGVAAHLFATEGAAEDPDTRVALATSMDSVAEASRTALTELRGTLDVLRAPTDLPAAGGEEQQPLPTLDRLPDLLRATRAAGIAVEVGTSGEQRPLPSAVDIAAYRILQEALTNVVKHALGAGRADVQLGYHPGELRLTVTDDGATGGTPATREGYGILGMTERAHAVGGRLTAGLRAGGGFEVAVVLPVTGRQASGADGATAPPGAEGESR